MTVTPFGPLLKLNMFRIHLSILCLIACVLGGHQAVAASREDIGVPNIVLIVAEEFGLGDLSVNGQDLVKTPRLDQMSREGLRFTNYYAGGTEGVVSRAAMLTGKHSGHSEIRGRSDYALASLDPTLGDLAKRAGYHTAAIGKWGLGGPGSSGLPTVRGFDEWFGYLTEAEATNHYPVTLWRNQTNLFWSDNQNDGKAHYAPYLFTQSATNFIRLNRRKPFFLYLSYPLPAAPLQSPTDKPYHKKDWPAPQKTLAAMIHRLDRDIGRVLDALKASKVEQQTVVLFSGGTGPHADAGIDPKFFNSTSGLRGHKGELYDGGIKVPLIIRWPGVIRAGATSDHLCAAWDLYPTIANLMGLADFDPGDGISMTPELVGRRQSQHDYLYWEHHGSGGFMQALRQGDWKAIRRGGSDEVEVYRLDRDPGEMEDVSERYRRTTRRLVRDLDSARTESSVWPSPVDGR